MGRFRYDYDSSTVRPFILMSDLVEDEAGEHKTWTTHPPKAKHGVPHTVIADNAGGHLMRRPK